MDNMGNRLAFLAGGIVTLATISLVQLATDSWPPTLRAEICRLSFDLAPTRLDSMEVALADRGCEIGPPPAPRDTTTKVMYLSDTASTWTGRSWKYEAVTIDSLTFCWRLVEGEP